MVADADEVPRAWQDGSVRARISSMTGRAHKVLEEALSLSEDERLDLAERLLSSLPADPEWLAELERRARRALADPSGGEAWEVVERRIDARFASR
jgi:putative addiction module component (TIGR02574 family)